MIQIDEHIFQMGGSTTHQQLTSRNSFLIPYGFELA